MFFFFLQQRDATKAQARTTGVQSPWPMRETSVPSGKLLACPSTPWNILNQVTIYTNVAMYILHFAPATIAPVTLMLNLTLTLTLIANPNPYTTLNQKPNTVCLFVCLFVCMYLFISESYKT